MPKYSCTSSQCCTAYTAVLFFSLTVYHISSIKRPGIYFLPGVYTGPAFISTCTCTRARAILHLMHIALARMASLGSDYYKKASVVTPLTNSLWIDSKLPRSCLPRILFGHIHGLQLHCYIVRSLLPTLGARSETQDGEAAGFTSTGVHASTDHTTWTLHHALPSLSSAYSTPGVCFVYYCDYTRCLFGAGVHLREAFI